MNYSVLRTTRCHDLVGTESDRVKDSKSDYGLGDRSVQPNIFLEAVIFTIRKDAIMYNIA